MIKADVCTCPLRPESDRQPLKRDPLYVPIATDAPHKNLGDLADEIGQPVTAYLIERALDEARAAAWTR